jgi:dTMP kinase
MRGKFIVLEGLDRSGKTTQVAKLVERLDARLQKFPGELAAELAK